MTVEQRWTKERRAMHKHQEITKTLWNQRSTFDQVHGAMYHQELARLGIRTGDALYVNTGSGESAITIRAESYSQIEQARNFLETYDVGVSELPEFRSVSHISDWNGHLLITKGGEILWGFWRDEEGEKVVFELRGKPSFCEAILNFKLWESL